MPTFIMNVEWLDLLVVILYTASLTALNKSYIRWVKQSVFVDYKSIY